MDPGASREVCIDSSSPAVFALVLDWLSCCVGHDEAYASSDKIFVSRQFFNVYLQNQTDYVFLVGSTGPTTYACLSYCWGEDSEDVLLTTKDNIEAHFSGIPIRSMSGSVQDAVRVCRGLGIPHLWMGSFRILQGNPGKWLHDSFVLNGPRVSPITSKIATLEPATCKSDFL